MTEINFHHGVADPLAYACRLLLKAQQRGARVAVVAEADALERLDVQLWTFDATSFVPHLRVREPAQAALADTPISLVERTGDALHHEVLVNLGPQIAPGFESFERLFEIVGSADEARAAGRERLRHYKSRGYEIVLHEVRP
ncbi:MAG: DNA polymerase III subunit chi [Methylibium sp.]|uniref:DNA polymerase III subunit chi n=1 Tax=Methylibium sp. TaxID=2067992 RepID=UPI0017F4ACCF|nr:DNA polymerase III subunit chi [Methylibium sp.]MBA3597621.1 DNA polymerase III subunit chi [Methylibium sp.]